MSVFSWVFDFYYDWVFVFQSQLKEAKEGLSAASRLTEQLDHKSGIISDMKKQGEFIILTWLFKFVALNYHQLLD